MHRLIEPSIPVGRLMHEPLGRHASRRRRPGRDRIDSGTWRPPARTTSRSGTGLSACSKSVEQRTPAQRDLALRLQHLRMRGEPLHVHRQRQFHGVAALPLPPDRRIASHHLRRHGGAVHANGRVRRPSRQPDMEREFARRIRPHGDLHVAFPRVVRDLLQRDLCRSRAAVVASLAMNRFTQSPSDERL